jgi:hypothetical protein
MCFQAKPYLVGLGVDGQKTGSDPDGRDQGEAGPVGCWDIGDVEGILEPLAGAEIESPLAHVRGDALVATLPDPDGYPIGLLQNADGA